MARHIFPSLLPIVTSVLSAAVAAAPETVRIETCLEAATATVPGDFVKVEFLDPSAEGVPAYEIEVRDAQGGEWELMCNAATGHIFEIEQEAESAEDPRFRGRAKVSAAQAQETVLALYPGEVKEIEFEIENNGAPTYEIDLLTKDGREFKIEVDAVSGEIIEVAVERWEIGEEADEEP
jgi:uncharacterized membrane protein YkoI